MATTVVDWELDHKRYTDAFEVADTILQRFPLDGYTLIKRASAIGRLLQTECIERYPSRAQMPETMRNLCDSWEALNAEGFRRAEALGWTPSE